MGFAAVEADALHPSACGVEDGPSGGLVDAAGLHPYEAALDHVEAPDAVGPAEAVQLGQDGRGGHGDAVNRNLTMGIKIIKIYHK